MSEKLRNPYKELRRLGAGLKDLQNSLVRERIDGKAKNIIIFIGEKHRQLLHFFGLKGPSH